MDWRDARVCIEAGHLAEMLNIYWDGTYTPDTPDSEEMVQWLLGELAKPENERRTYGWRMKEYYAARQAEPIA